MLGILRTVLIPLISISIFVLGNGFLVTLLVLRMNLAGASSFVIGAMSGFYYLGLFIGSFRIEKMILRIGHIRAFSAFASILAVATLLHGIYYNVPFWLLLRVISGFATAGIYIVVESWLLVAGDIKVRGQILSLYMVAFYAAQALGQFFLNLGDPENLYLYAISAMLCSLSVIPITMASIGQPQITEPSVLNFKKLYKASASGVLGCICSGLILSAIYGLLPLVVVRKLHSTAEVSTFMAAVIFGGMVLQYPLGKLSDHMDRRIVLIGLTLALIASSVLCMLTIKNIWISYAVMFLFGGVTFTLYPVSISHACDALKSSDIVSGTQSLMLAYSIGAIVGPLLGPFFIRFLGVNGLYIYFIVIGVLLSVFFMWRRISTPVTMPEEPFQSMPQTTPVTAELDPRT